MKFFSTLLWFGGYILVYAAVAKGGRFATEPWEGLFNDAYTGERTPETNPSQLLDPNAPRLRNTPPPDLGGTP